MGKKADTNGTAPPGIADGVNRAVSDEEGKKLYPTLAWCIDPIWKDGKCIRPSGDLRIRTMGGYYLVTVHCSAEQQETTLVTDTLVQLLEQLERHLVAPTTIWLPDWQAAKKSRQPAKE